MKESVLAEKAGAFSDRIIKMNQYLHRNADINLRPLFQQILRSGTSIDANIGEAQFAASKADFVNKMRIALKEANETYRWLNRLKNSDIISTEQFDSMIADLNQIIAMLVSSINTVSKTD